MRQMAPVGPRIDGLLSMFAEERERQAAQHNGASLAGVNGMC